MQTTVSKAEHALGFTLMGTRITPIAHTSDTGSDAGTDAAPGWEMFALDLAPGAGSPLHTLTADKAFAVTGGVVRLTVGDRVEDVAAGGFVLIPAGTPHNYANPSDAPAAMIGVVSGPGSQLEFLRGMGALTAHGRPDPAALAEHTARHGVRIMPTPTPAS